MALGRRRAVRGCRRRHRPPQPTLVAVARTSQVRRSETTPPDDSAPVTTSCTACARRPNHAPRRRCDQLGRRCTKGIERAVAAAEEMLGGTIKGFSRGFSMKWLSTLVSLSIFALGAPHTAAGAASAVRASPPATPSTPVDALRRVAPAPLPVLPRPRTRRVHPRDPPAIRHVGRARPRRRVSARRISRRISTAVNPPRRMSRPQVPGHRLGGAAARVLLREPSEHMLAALRRDPALRNRRAPRTIHSASTRI